MTVTRLSSDCPFCGRALRRRTGRNGDFLSCTGYPKCTFSESLDLNLERIETELRGARSDVEYLNSWIDILRQKIRAMKADSGVLCPNCAKHLAELEAML